VIEIDNQGQIALQETKTSPSLVSQLINKVQIVIIGIIKVIEIDNQGQIALQETKTSPNLVSQLINKAQIIITGIINVMERETKEKTSLIEIGNKIIIQHKNINIT
jgi:hypothetical protein